MTSLGKQHNLSPKTSPAPAPCRQVCSQGDFTFKAQQAPRPPRRPRADDKLSGGSGAHLLRQAPPGPAQRGRRLPHRWLSVAGQVSLGHTNHGGHAGEGAAEWKSVRP